MLHGIGANYAALPTPVSRSGWSPMNCRTKFVSTQQQRVTDGQMTDGHVYGYKMRHA